MLITCVKYNKYFYFYVFGTVGQSAFFKPSWTVGKYHYSLHINTLASRNNSMSNAFPSDWI